jgi:hypothetical protein
MKTFHLPLFIFFFLILITVGILVSYKSDFFVSGFNSIFHNTSNSQDRNQNSTQNLQLSDLTEKNYKETYNRWSQRFSQVGPSKTYEEFKKEYQDLTPFLKQHLLAHMFGSLLFNKMGIDGVAVCDDYSLYGCYHNFFAQAIMRDGLKAIPVLKEACSRMGEEVQLTCIHGIGHGLMPYLGKDKILEALKICEEISPEEISSEGQSLGGCSTAIFMEYTLSSASHLGINPLPLDLNDPYSPCAEIPKKFLPACYLNLPRWWMTVLEEDYTTVGKLCNGVKNESLRETCFFNIGRFMAVSVEGGVQKTLEVCRKAMPSLDAITFCIDGFEFRSRGLIK